MLPFFAKTFSGTPPLLATFFALSLFSAVSANAAQTFVTTCNLRQDEGTQKLGVTLQYDFDQRRVAFAFDDASNALVFGPGAYSLHTEYFTNYADDINSLKTETSYKRDGKDYHGVFIYYTPARQLRFMTVHYRSDDPEITYTDTCQETRNQ